MDWALAIEGRQDPAGVLLLFADRTEAEALARELRGRGGRRVCVRPFHPGLGTPQTGIHPTGPPRRAPGRP